MRMTSPQSVKPKLARDDRLDIALRLYQVICAQYPDRLIMLLDESGCVVAQSGYVGANNSLEQNRIKPKAHK